MLPRECSIRPNAPKRTQRASVYLNVVDFVSPILVLAPGCLVEAGVLVSLDLPYELQLSDTRHSCLAAWHHTAPDLRTYFVSAAFC
jgi:hypothetical protein